MALAPSDSNNLSPIGMATREPLSAERSAMPTGRQPRDRPGGSGMVEGVCAVGVGAVEVDRVGGVGERVGVGGG